MERLLLFSILAASAAAGGQDMTRHLLNGTNCLDGSEAGFYYSSATTRPDVAVIFLQGGGACTSYEGCVAWGANGMGSSDGWAATKASPTTVITDNCSSNPDFCGAHMIYVPYCTGDVHSGTRDTGAYEDGAEMFFSGHRNFAKIVDTIIGDLLGSGRHDASPLTSVLLTGWSAGGYGTFVNADWLAKSLSAEPALNVTTVKGAPVAGYFFPGVPPAETGSAPCPELVSDFSHESAGTSGNSACTSDTNALWRSLNISARCLADFGEEEGWKCDTANVAVQYIETPLHWGQNQYDSNQIFVQLGAPQDGSAAEEQYVAYYGGAALESMLRLLPDKDGAFVPSCLDHTNLVDILEVEYLSAMGDWFWGRSSARAAGRTPSDPNAATTLALPAVLYDNCTSDDGLPCNPNCANSRYTSSSAEDGIWL